MFRNPKKARTPRKINKFAAGSTGCAEKFGSTNYVAGGLSTVSEALVPPPGQLPPLIFVSFSEPFPNSRSSCPSRRLKTEPNGTRGHRIYFARTERRRKGRAVPRSGNISRTTCFSRAINKTVSDFPSVPKPVNYSELVIWPCYPIYSTVIGRFLKRH